MIKYNELPLRNFIVVGSRAFGLRDADDIDVLVYIDALVYIDVLVYIDASVYID